MTSEEVVVVVVEEGAGDEAVVVVVEKGQVHIDVVVVDSVVKALSPLGTAFQIKDDILGIYGNVKNLGKSTTSDITEFKQTILYSYVVNNTEYRDELRKYYGKTTLTEKEFDKVKEIFDKSGAKDYATKKMEQLFEESKSLVIKNRNIPTYYKEILLGFITFLEIRDN